MTGREEKDARLEYMLQSKLENYPSLLMEYYYSLASKTANTKKTYLSGVTSFLEYKQRMNGFESMNDESILNTTPVEINAFLSNQRIARNGKEKLGNAYIANQVSSLNSFFDYLVKVGHIEENPVSHSSGRPRVRPKDEIVYLTNGETRELYNSILTHAKNTEGIKGKRNNQNRDILIVTLFLVTGMRVGALVGINLEDIDFRKHQITVYEKGEKVRVYNLTASDVRLFEKWLSDREVLLSGRECKYLFPINYSKSLKRITEQAVRNLLTKYTVNINKNITPHRLRATFGTNVYRESNDIYLTAELMGHESPVTTRRYAVVDEKEKKKALLKNANKIYHNITAEEP